MRIHLSARTRSYTVLGNEVLRDRRLSFTARGILVYLLSLPDDAREDVRTLADRHPGLGRRGVAKALDELVACGYYIRRTTRDGVTGQLRTEAHVFDIPHPAGAPLPPPAGTGGRRDGRTGTSPKGVKKPGKVPTLPRAGEPDTGPGPKTPEGRGAALLSRLGKAEPKLALGAADALTLAPLAARWLERGVSEPEVRSLLTAGLPAVVHSARALLADRLVRKLPAPRVRPDDAAPATPPAECAKCRNPLPRGQRTGTCARCAGVAAPAQQDRAAARETAARVAALRAVVRCRA